MIGAVAPTTTIQDTSDIFLETPWGSGLVATVDGVTYVYMAGERDSGLSVFRLDASGQLTNLQNIADTELLELEGAQNVVAASAGGQTFIYVNAYGDNGVSGFRVDADGVLVNVANVTDDAGLRIQGTDGRMSVAAVGGSQFLIVPAYGDDGFSVFHIEADGALVNTASVSMGSGRPYTGPVDTTVAVVDGRTFLVVASHDDVPVSVFELQGDGSAVFCSAGAMPGGDVGGWGVTTATVGGVTYVVVSSPYANGVTVYSMNGSGTLAPVLHLDASSSPAMSGPKSLSAFDLDGEAFVAVAMTDAVAIYHLGAGGTLMEVAALAGAVDTEFNGVVSTYVGYVGGKPFLTAVSRDLSALTVVDIGSGDDNLFGTSANDLLLGLGGDDRLDGGGGTDRMIGGSGGDTFVVDQTGDQVIERAGGGIDTVVASVSYRLGAHLENLVLEGMAADGFGNDAVNGLTGNASNNRLFGLGGNDWLAGRGGDDRLNGGAGSDRLVGGGGQDVLAGGEGADTFIYRRPTESGAAGTARDRILDFADGDRIDLSAVDAKLTVAGDQAFSLDTDGDFAIGEIKAIRLASGTLLQMNIDASAKAAMALLLVGFTGPLDAGDFVF